MNSCCVQVLDTPRYPHRDRGSLRPFQYFPLSPICQFSKHGITIIPWKAQVLQKRSGFLLFTDKVIF